MEDLIRDLQQTQVISLFVVMLLLFVWESLHPFYAWFTDGKKGRGRHVFRNLLLGLLNGLVVGAVFVGLWFAVSVWADNAGFGLLHFLEGKMDITGAWRAILAVLLLDFWMYVWHRMNHEIPFFWRFHKVHHSDNKMDVTTASRFHTGEIILSSVFRIAVIALLGIRLWELVLYEILMFAVVQFHHANIRIPEKADHFLRFLIVTPSMHRVHHSRWQPETDSNYSSLFSFWDRMARTFRINPNPENIQIGLDDFDKDDKQSLKGMLKTPFE